MLTQTLKILYTRDLEQLKRELELYSTETGIWRTSMNISNSAGNLSLHLIGNLNTYIGAVLGDTGYQRDRDEEFSSKNISWNELTDRITNIIKMIGEVLGTVTAEQLNYEYPQVVSIGKVSTEHFLVHLATHLSYHLGQVNYHRRLLDY